MSINTNHVNHAFNREIDFCKEQMKNRFFDVCGYSAEFLLDRLMHHIVDIGLTPYIAAAVNSSQTASCNRLLDDGSMIDCGRCALIIGSGQIKLTVKQWISNQCDFFLHWFFCLIQIFRSAKSDLGALPAVLVFGVGEESIFKGGSDKQFIDYCCKGPIEPLSSGQRFLVESTVGNLSSSSPNFSYCSKPHLRLLHEAKMGFWGIFSLLIKHSVFLFEYLFATFRLPQLSLLGRELAYSKIIFALDERRLIKSIVITCSHFRVQPLWMRQLHHAKIHMVWYAQNWRPVAYLSDALLSDFPQLRWIRVDVHWAWTHAFAGYLATLKYTSIIKVVGPILWALPVVATRPRHTIKIVVFDVPPFSNEIALSCGEISNYYHPDNLFTFIKDMLLVKLELASAFQQPIHLCLKTKRGYSPVYDKNYYDYLDELNAMDCISIVPYSTNMYSLISSSQLVIVYPFSSPAYVADSLGVPSIYYDPTKSIIRTDFCDEPSLIHFASGFEEFSKQAVSILNKVVTLNNTLGNPEC